MSNVHGLPVPEPEHYVKRVKMAKIMGISPRTFDELRAEGRAIGFPCPEERWSRQTLVFPPSRTIAWARALAARREAEAA